MKTMTSIMEKPMLKQVDYSLRNKKPLEDTLTFKSFLDEATKAKQEAKPDDDKMKSKDNPTDIKNSDDVEIQEVHEDLTKDHDQENETTKKVIPLVLNQLPQTRTTLESTNMDEIPVMDSLPVQGAKEVKFVQVTPKSSQDQDNLPIESLQTNGKKMTENSQMTLTEAVGQTDGTTDVKIPGFNPINEENKKEQSSPKTSQLTKDSALTTKNMENLKDVSKESSHAGSKDISVPSELASKDVNAAKFNETRISTDIESKGKNSVKDSVESDSLKPVDVDPGKKTSLEEKAELQKMIFERMYPKIQNTDKKEIENPKEADPRLRHQLPPSMPGDKVIMDVKVQPKSPVVLETFQKNLDMATEQIMSRVTTLKEGADTTMTLKLFPKELGEMEISLHLSEGKISGKILTDHKDVRELFLKNMDELTHTLKENKVNVTKFEVGGFTQNSFSQSKQEENKRLFQGRGLKPYGVKEESSNIDLEYTSKKVQKGLNILA